MTVDIIAPVGVKALTVRNVCAVLSYETGYFGVTLFSGAAYAFPPGYSLRIYNEKEKVENGGN